MPSQIIDIYSGDRDDFVLYATIGSKESTAVESINGADIVISGDFSGSTSSGEEIRLQDHPSEGLFEVDTISYDSNVDETTITVVNAPSDASNEGYILFPWNIRDDFDAVRAEAKLSESGQAFLSWDTEDGSLDIQDGRGAGDKLVFIVQGADTADISDLPLKIDVEAEDASGDLVTIIKKDDLKLNVISDVTTQ